MKTLTKDNCPLYLLNNGKYNKISHPEYGVIVLYGDTEQMRNTPDWRNQLVYTQGSDGSWFARLPKAPQYTVADF